MIDYYTVKTLEGNSRKVSIMLAETALEHVVHFIDLATAQQKQPWFVAIHPDGRIPAIVDHGVPGGLSIGESGAILVYLAEKSGRFLPRSEPARSKALQWLFWQVGGIGPMLGQWTYFARDAPQQVPFATERYRAEGARLLGVLDAQLARGEYVAGDYSIADMASYPWVKPAFAVFQLLSPALAASWHGIARWLDTMAARPCVALAMSRFEGSASQIGVAPVL